MFYGLKVSQWSKKFVVFNWEKVLTKIKFQIFNLPKICFSRVKSTLLNSKPSYHLRECFLARFLSHTILILSLNQHSTWSRIVLFSLFFNVSALNMDTEKVLSYLQKNSTQKFIIVENWEPPKNPSVNKGWNKLFNPLIPGGNKKVTHT